jgi:D-alanyl-D-alanine carboxypeptidase (penicillin-binding protein 5/6)
MQLNRLLYLACVLAALWPAWVFGQSLADRLNPLVRAHEGQVAVAVRHLKTNETFRHNADEPMPTASLIKLPVMVEAYRQAAETGLDLDQKLTLTAADKVPGSGVLTTHFSPGATISLRDAIRLMIAYSDNTATNLVLQKIGLPATNVTMEKLGLPHTKVHSYVFRRESSILPERSKEFGLGSTSAGEMVGLLAKLQARELMSTEACEEMLAHLRTCEDRRIPKLLPAGTKVAHKTGSVAAVRTAAAIIETPSGPIALCVLTKDNKDQRWTDENAAEVLTSKIAKAVHDHFEAAGTSANVPGKNDAVSEVLRQGASGELVQTLQRTLNARLEPSPDLAIDGDFGPGTKAAVEAFQRAKSLEVTGEVGPDTFKALGPLLLTAEPVPPPAEVNGAELAYEPAESLEGPPLVTCKAWAIGDAKTGKLLWGHNENAQLDIASTTKMMTAYVVCQLAKDDPAVLDQVVTFSAAADKTNGSTADLREGEKVSVGELLYGLLLPSGNDAATALAEHFGPQLPELAAAEGEKTAPPPESPTAPFVAAMNCTAQHLGMAETRYINPHGLTAKEHKSSAADQLKLARAALHDPLVRKYIATRQHGTTVAGPGGYERNVLWKNTNKLLQMKGYTGIKTGTTDAAGACLVACGQREGSELIVVVLGSVASDARYTDARNLFRWAWRQQGQE